MGLRAEPLQLRRQGGEPWFLRNRRRKRIPHDRRGLLLLRAFKDSAEYPFEAVQAILQLGDSRSHFRDFRKRPDRERIQTRMRYRRSSRLRGGRTVGRVRLPIREGLCRGGGSGRQGSRGDGLSDPARVFGHFRHLAQGSLDTPRKSNVNTLTFRHPLDGHAARDGTTPPCPA